MRKILILILLLLLALPVGAQVGDEEVDLVSFTSAPLNIQGLHPEGWLPQEGAEGVFIRLEDALDQTAMIIQAQPVSPQAFINNVTVSFQLTEVLEVIETYEGNFLTWDVYQFNRDDLIVDMAVAFEEESERTFYVLMQTNDFSYDNLHANAFFPVLDWVAPIQFYEDADEMYAVPLPVKWLSTESDEGFVQLSHIDNEVRIFITVVETEDPIVAVEEFLVTVNSDFDQTFDEEMHALTVIDDPASIGDLDAVQVINWVNGNNEDGFFLQTVTRLHDGVAYIMLIVTNANVLAQYETDLAQIDRGFTVLALRPSAEETAEPEE